MLLDLSISELAGKLHKSEITISDILAECQKNITDYNGELNALITVVAPKSDDRKNTSLLNGLPYVLKDCYSTKNIRTTCASKVLANYIPPYDATVNTRLNESGALLVGKTNLDAWGHGGSNENTDFGPAKNPWDTSRVPGGSSGGVAVAISSRMCLFGIGEDTGGSIRNPAGWCNVTGLKVTYGRVSRYGTIAYASSFDSVGPMAKTAEDCAYILKEIAGIDSHDATSSPELVLNYPEEIKKDVNRIKVGIPKEYFSSDLDHEVKQLIENAIVTFNKMGIEIIDISLPTLKHAVSTYYLLAPSETSSNLARYDGNRFGTSRDNFTDETKRRIMVGTYALSTGYYDAYYKKAQQIRTLIINDYAKAFSQCDAILAPISPTKPPKIGELINDPVKNWLADIYTVTTNPAGIPALALPCGFTKDNLPIGMQIQGPMFSESLLLKLGYHYQQVTDWHKRRPPMVVGNSTNCHSVLDTETI